MASCLENIQIPTCLWFESGDKRNAIASMVAGTLVGKETVKVVKFPIFLDYCNYYSPMLYLKLILARSLDLPINLLVDNRGSSSGKQATPKIDIYLLSFIAIRK